MRLWRMLVLLVLWAALALAAGAGGCVDAELGDVPLFCNPGDPRCPQGFRCVPHEGRSYCVREGVAPEQVFGPSADGSAADGG